MKIVVERSELQKKLDIACRVSSANSTLDILSCVLISAQDTGVTLTCNNLDAAIEIEVDAKVEGTGEVAVHAKRLLSLLKTLGDGSLALEAEKVFLHIRNGTGHFVLCSEEADGFPASAEVEGEVILVPASDLLLALRRVSFAVSKDPLKFPFLYFHDDVVVATSGAEVLAKAVLPLSSAEFSMYIQSAKTLMTLLKGMEGDMQLVTGSEFVKLVADGMTFIFRSESRDYPPYQIVLKKMKDDAEATVKVSRAEMLAAVRRIKLFCGQKHRLLRCDVGEGLIKMSCHDEETGTSDVSLKCETTGSALIGLNVDVMSAVLENVQEENITVSFLSAEKPVFVKVTNDHIIAIMPMRLGGEVEA